MSIRSSIDPKEYNKNSPTLDTVVTGESCFYYISLLKTFHDLRKSMTNDEYIIFVYAAVWRYTEFLFNTRPDAYTNSMALPLDIAYVWHAHMLNPFQYYEDIAKQPSRECSIGIHFDFPLKAMHDTYQEDLKRTPLPKASPVHDEASQSTDMSAPAISMHPFNLTLAEIARQCSRERNQNHLTCTLCKTRLYHTWEHAALWRSDPNVEIQCNYKLDRHHSYTLDTYLVNHVMAVLRNGFRGPLLDRDGYEKSDESLKEYETLCKELCESLETRKFRLLRNPDALYEALLSNGAELDRKKRTKGKYKKFAEELVQLLRARYEGNPTPEFSLDLIQAVLRLNEFVESIAETPSLHQPESIAYSIHRYYEFLQVYKTSKRPIVPNIDMDLVWHLHMLHPQTYRRSMMGFMQKIPNHDAIISPCGLDSHLEETRRMWKTFRSNPVQPQPVANPRPDPEPKKENKKFSLLRITKKPKIPFNNTKKTGTTLNYISGTFAPTVFSKPTRRGNKVGTITDLGSETSAISFHNWQSTREYLPSDTPPDTLDSMLNVDNEQEKILVQARSTTGYGYIGTITRNVIRQEKARKRIVDGYAPEFPVQSWPLQKYTGRILPGQSIFGLEDYTTKTKYKFWSSRRGGLMYRAYNDSVGEYGWTTNGYDWYSEEECQFVLSEPGEFEGTEFLGLAQKIVVGHMALRRNPHYVYDTAAMQRMVPPPQTQELLFSQRSSVHQLNRTFSNHRSSFS